MQAHAPKQQHHLGGSFDYLARHLGAALLVIGLLAAAGLAAIAISNATDDARTIQAPNIVAPAPSSGFRFLEQNTALPPYTGAAVQSRITSPYVPGQGEGRLGGSADLLVSPVPASIDHQRFLDLNIYLPGYTVERQLTAPLSGEDMLMLEQNLTLPGYTPYVMPDNGIVGSRDENGLLPISPVRSPSVFDIQTLEQNLYLPSDGTGFVDVEAPVAPAVLVTPSDFKFMEENLYLPGAIVQPTLRLDASYRREGAGEGWVGNGTPLTDTPDTARPADRGPETNR